MQISIPVLVIAQIGRRGKGIFLFIASPVLEQVVCVEAVIYIWHGCTKVLVSQIEIKKIIKTKPIFTGVQKLRCFVFFCIVHFFCLLFSQHSLELSSNCVRAKMVFYILTTLYQYIMDHIRFRGVKRRGSQVFVCEKPNQITVRYGYLLLHA